MPLPASLICSSALVACSAEQATKALEQIKDAGSGKTTLELGWIDQIRVAPPRAVFRLNLPGFAQSQRERIASEARELLMGLEGINDVQIEVGQAPTPSQGSIGRCCPGWEWALDPLQFGRR